MTNSSLLLHAVNIALKAGKLLKRGYGTVCEISSKDGRHNLVTEYDLLSEKTIIQMIKQSYPDHHILSEECGSKGKNHAIQWIVDPLDGTVNFAHQIPMFSVSIGILKENTILGGVVYNPIAEELFFCEKGKGAFLNGERLSVSKVDHISNAILATGFPYNVIEDPLNCIDKLSKVLRLGIPIRRIGVASLDLCYVASGRFDGFWEIGLKPWDCIVGKLMIEEAKGKVTTWEMQEFGILSGDPIMGSNCFIHEQLYKVLNG
jgi:myo-inositol-1(or 4)-monophosphatase